MPNPLREPRKNPPTQGVSGRSRLVVLAKHWTPGRSKTRLASAIGDAHAAAIGREMLEATLQRLATTGDERWLAGTPAEELEDFSHLATGMRGDWRPVAQPPGDLGARMASFLHANDVGEPPITLCFGADSPDLPTAAVEAALAWLRRGERRFVLGPTDDGGYWMVGARGPLPAVFDAMPWGTPDVLPETLSRLRTQGWKRGVDYELTAPWYDVDDVVDLAALRRRLDDAAAGDTALERLTTTLAALGVPEAPRPI